VSGLRRAAAAILAVALLGATPRQLQIVNVMPAFWQAWDSTQGRSSAARVAEALSGALAQATPATVQTLACGIAQQWTSRDDNVFSSYLDAGQSPQGLPPMGGYLVGYLVAKDLSKTYTVADLGKMNLPQVEALMRPRVDRLCRVGAL
jgi:hypothetical protein